MNPGTMGIVGPRANNEFIVGPRANNGFIVGPRANNEPIVPGLTALGQ